MLFYSESLNRSRLNKSFSICIQRMASALSIAFSPILHALSVSPETFRLHHIDNIIPSGYLPYLVMESTNRQTDRQTGMQTGRKQTFSQAILSRPSDTPNLVVMTASHAEACLAHGQIRPHVALYPPKSIPSSLIPLLSEDSHQYIAAEHCKYSSISCNCFTISFKCPTLR